MYKLPELDEEKVKEEICLFIENKVSKANCEGIVIGLSGGIDSTVSAYLSAQAIGCENVFGIHMYSSTTPKEDTDHARLMARLLEIEYKEINIDKITKEFLKEASKLLLFKSAFALAFKAATLVLIRNPILNPFKKIQAHP